MGFKQVLEPAARIAEDGFGVTERIAGEWKQYAELLAQDPDTKAAYLPGGQPAAPLFGLSQPEPGQGLPAAAAGTAGTPSIKGTSPKAIVAKSQATGGTFTLQDFGKIKAQWVTPLTTSYRGYDVYQMPPSTQGVAVLEALNIVEQCGPKLGIEPLKEGPRAPAFWHLMVEAKKLAYADLRRYIGDPDYTKIPTDMLTSKPYAASLCAKIDPRRASAIESAPGARRRHRLPDHGRQVRQRRLADLQASTASSDRA